MRALLILGIAFGVLCLAFGGFVFNKYLKDTNRWPYATGTSEKAFLNSTWRMSLPEIERANHTNLQTADDIFEFVGSPSVMDKKRYSTFTQKDVELFGYPADVHYAFFDGKLYNYYINLKTYDMDKSVQEIRSAIEGQFGPGKPDKLLGDEIIRLVWNSTHNQSLLFWVDKNAPAANELQSYTVGFNATYKPFEDEINSIINTEKKRYF